MTEPYLFYRARAQSIGVTDKLPQGYCDEVSRPSIFEATKFKLGPVGDLLPAKMLHMGRPEAFTIYVIRDASGSLVHRSIVSAPDFRYPFMAPNDLMIGGLWTEPAHRNRGLASWTVRRILDQANIDGVSGWLWYVVASDNASSVRVAIKNGLTLDTSGHKTRRLGATKLGVFVRESVAGSRRNYAALTEQWDMPMTREQIAMAGRRYHWLAAEAAGRRVLEIGCGVGVGLDYLGERTTLAVGGDITDTNLAAAKKRLPHALVTAMDGEFLPFADNSFDIAAAFEVLYYIARPHRALEEAHRVLCDGGKLLICLPNRDRPGFHASPQSTHYFSVPELVDLLRKAGFRPSIYGGFRAGSGGVRELAVVSLTSAATSLGLVPRSLEGRRRIKRLVYGELVPLTRLTDETPEGEALLPLEMDRPTSRFKNLYAVGIAAK